MATEADITEVLLPTKGEGEAVCLTAAQLEKTVIETLAVELKLNELRETEDKQVESTTQVEITKNVVRSNNSSGTLEDASFLASVSGPAVSNEEASGPEDSRVDKLDPLETVIPENAKHPEKVQQAEVLDEVVYEVDQNGKTTHDVLNTINEDSSEVAKSGEPKPEAEVDGAVKNETSLERNVEVILKDEKQGKMEESYTKPSSEEIPSIDEGALDRKIEACTDVQSVEETSSSKRATLSEEYTEERSSEDIKEDKCVDIVTEEKVSEAILSKEDTETEKEKDQIIQDRIDDVSDSTISSSQESRSNETSDTKKDDPKRITTFIKEGDIQNLEESLKEQEKEEETISVPQVKGNEVSTEEIVKIESTEAELPKNDSGDLPAVRLLVEQAEVLNGRNDDVSELKSHEDATKEFNKEVLEELEIVGVSESTQCETKKEIESTAEESLQKQEEEDKSLNPIEASIEETKVVISEEVLRSRDEDDVHPQEITEGDVDKEHTIEREISSSLTESIQEETDKSYQDNKNEAEKSNEEESSGEILQEADVKELSPETVQEVAIETSKDHANEAETSKETAIDESIPCETTKDVERIVDASQVKQEENKQEVKSSVEDNKGEDESHGHNTKVDFDKEQTIAEVTVSASELVQEETSTNSHDTIKEEEKISEESTAEITEENSKNYLPTETIQDDVIKKSEDHEKKVESSKEKAVEELEIVGRGDTIPCETEKDVESFIHALPAKQEDGLEEVKHRDPTEVLVEENKVGDEALTSGGEFGNNERSIKVDFEKEEIIEEVALSATDSTQEETSNNTNDKEKAHEENAEEIIKEESASQFSEENTQEDAIEKFKDHENETETCEDKVVPELEAVEEGRCIPSETNKDVAGSVDTLLVKQEEDQQQVQYVEPIKDSVEVGKVEVLEEVTSNPSNRDDNHGQIADFDKEQTKEEVTVSTPEFQEENKKSPQDKTQAEDIKEESKTVSINEEAIEKLEKDQEAEAEKCKEVAQVFETPKTIESSPKEINKEAEHFVDASLEKQEEAKLQDRVEDSIENIAEDTASIEVVKDVNENPDEVTETGIEVASKTEGNQQAEHENKEEKVEELHQETPEENEAQNLEETSETEKAENVDHTTDLEKEITEVETTEASESIQYKTSEDALQKSVVAPSEKQDDEKEENKGEGSMEASKVENKVDTEVVKEDDENEVTEKGIDVSYKGEEDSQQTTKEAESGEKLETSVLVTPRETETGPSSENAPSYSVEVEENAKNLEETSETGKEEKTTEKIDNTNDSEEVVQELKTAEADESISCDTSESSTDPSPEKQEEVQYIDPAKVLIEEKKVEDTLSAELAKDGHDSKVEATEKTIEVEATGKEDERAMQIDEPGEKLEELPQVIPEETATEAKETLVNVEETLETETKEEKTEEIHEVNDSEKEVVQELEAVKDVESCVEPSSEKQEEDQCIEPAEVLIEEKKVEGTLSTEVVQDNHDSKDGVAERTIEVADEGKEFEEQTTPKDKPGEKLEDLVQVIPESENAGTSTSEEVEETIDNVEKSSEKQEEIQNLEAIEVLTEEKKVEDTLLVEKAEDDQDNKTEATESKTDVAKEGGKDEIQAIQKDEPGEKLEDLNQVTLEETEAEQASKNAGTSAGEEVAETIENLEKLSVKQEESQYLEPTEALTVEKKVEDTLLPEIVKDDRDNNVEATERRIDVAEVGDKDENQVIQKDESGEKLEDLVQEKPEETETKPASENAGTITCKEVEETVDNLEETSERAKQEKFDTSDPEKEVAQETTVISDDISYDTNKEVESYGDPSSEKKEEDQYLEPAEVLEKKVEGTLSAEAVKGDNDNKVEDTERTIDVVAKDEEDEKQASEEDKEEEKLENLVQVTPEETETESTKENAGSSTCEEVEGTNQIEETSEAENKGEYTNSVDNTIDSEKEVTETSGGSQVSREIDFTEESRQKGTDTETTEDTKEPQVITEPSSLLQEENVEEISKELVKEEGAQSKEKEQSEVPDLVEETKPGSLEEIAKQNEDLHSTATTEAPEKENDLAKSDYDVAVEEKDLATDADVHAQSREVLAADLSGEICLKEAEPESEKQLESSDIAPEDKSLDSGVEYVKLQSGDVSTEIVGEEAGLKEAKKVIEEQAGPGLKEVKPDEEEKPKSFEAVSEEKDFSSIVNIGLQSESVSTEIASGETSLKETEQEHEERVRSYDIASEDKGAASSVDVDVHSDSLSGEVVSEETCLKEDKPADEEQVKNLDIGSQSDRAPTGTLSEEAREQASEEQVRSYDAVSEEKGLASSLDVDVTSDSISATLSEETSLKEDEPINEEQVKSNDIAPEEKGLPSEVKSDSVPTDTASPEKCSHEAKQDDERVKTSEVAPEEKSLLSSVDTDVQYNSLSTESVSEETVLKEDKPVDEEQIKSLDIGSQCETLPTGTLSDEVRLREPDSDSEEHVRSYDTTSEEKGATSSLDVDAPSDSILTTIPSEEISLKEVELSNVEQIKSDDISREEKGLDGEVKFESVAAEAETFVPEAKQDDDQVKTFDVAAEEKSLPSSVETDVQYESVSTSLNEVKADTEQQADPQATNSILTTLPSEDASLKEVELSNEEQIKSDDISPEEKGVDSEVKFDSTATEAETCVPEAKQDDDQVKTSDVAPEEKNLLSSVETDVQYESVSTSLKEVKTDTEQQADPQATEPPSKEIDVEKVKQDHEEQVGSPDIAPEDANLVRDVDIGIQSNSALDEVVLKEDKPIYKEHVEFSDVVEREAVESNVDGDEEPGETLKPEEDEENKALETAGEYEEKTRQETADESPIARPDSQQKEIAAETPLHDSSEENLKDNSSVPSTEQEVETTKASERSDETTAPDNSQCEDKKILVIEPTKEEEELKQEGDSKLESDDTNKEIVNEETQELNKQPEIIIKDAIPTEVHGGVEEAVESGGESITSEFQPTPTGAERVIEEKYSSQKLTEVKETDSNEQTSESQVEGYAAEKIEESVLTVAEPKEENLHVDVSIATTEEGKIEEEIGGEVENKGDNVDTTVGDKKAVTSFEEAQLIEEPVKPVDKPESITLEERSFDLVSEQPAEQEDREGENIVPEKCSVDEVEQVKLASNTECIADATSPIPAEQLQETDAIEEETKEASEQVPDDEISKEQRQAPSSTLLPEKQDRETTTVETKEDLSKERQGRHGTEEDSITAHEAVLESSYESSQGVSKDEVVADRDLPIGISTETIQVSSSALVPEKSEFEAASIVQKAEEENTEENEILDDKKIKDSLETEVAEETKVKEEPEEDIAVVPVTASNNANIVEVATEGENIEKSDSQSLPLKEQNDGTIVEQIVKDVKTEEATLGDEMRDYSETATTEETSVLKEEIKEVKVSEEDGEEIKDAVNTVSDTDSQSAQVATEERTIICETFAEKPLEVQLVEQSGESLPTEQDDGTKSTAKEEVEKEKSKEVEILGYENKETSSETTAGETALTKEEPIDIKESASTLEVLRADIVEDTSEASETVSRETPETEVVSRDISAFQAVLTDNNEIIAENVATVEKIEKEDQEEAKSLDKDVCLDKEEPKKVELSEPGIPASDGSQEGQKEVLEVEARKADSPTEQDKATETNEARDFVSDKVESPEPITSIEDVEIIEDHLKIATTDMRTLESQFEKKIEAQEVTEKESCKEELSTEFGQEKSSLSSIEEPEEIRNTTCIEKTPLEAQTQVTTRGVEASTEPAEPTEETSPRDEKVSKSELVSPSDLMQSSDHPTEGTEEPKKKKEAESEKAKTDKREDGDEEEEEDEDHEDSEHPDAPILVQSSKDVDAKASHKKSHGLFSGVGSKVKHSISKVKKAITGKSSNSKTQPSSS